MPRRTLKGYQYDTNWCDTCLREIGRNAWMRHLQGAKHGEKFLAFAKRIGVN